MMDTLASALRLLLVALERLRVRYLIGGSVASSARGVLRATMDVDLLAAIRPGDADRFAAELGPGWYAHPEAIRESIRAGRAFNVIHIATGQKFDIFPPTGEFHLSELARATPVTLELPDGAISCPVATAEDILLAKLDWYRSGGEVSERQWTDILGILAANPALDSGYLLAWARRLGVEDLLARAIRSAPASGLPE